MLENPWSAVGNPISALCPSGSSFGPSRLAPIEIRHLLLSNLTTGERRSMREMTEVRQMYRELVTTRLHRWPVVEKKTSIRRKVKYEATTHTCRATCVAPQSTFIDSMGGGTPENRSRPQATAGDHGELNIKL